MSEADESSPDVRVGPYRVVAELARGGMAAVYLAVREDRGEVVAIKQIHPHLAHDPDFVAMLMDEARIASMIHHPNVIEIRDTVLGDPRGQNYIAMEYAEGEALSLVIKDSIARGTRLDYAMSASIGADVAGALHAAHELRGPDGVLLDIVHRDVSPQNVMLTYGGEVKLTDFGIAKAVGRLQRTQPGEIKGKLAYMAPEQAYGRPVDRRSDLYSLGVVLFELALGRRLFGGKTDAETIRNIMQHTVPPPRSIDPNFPEAYEEILLALLMADPAQRFQSAGALERALRALATSIDPGDITSRRAAFLQGLEPDRYRQKRALLAREAGRARTPTRPAVMPQVPSPAPVPTAPSQPSEPPSDPATWVAATRPRPGPAIAAGAAAEADPATLVRPGSDRAGSVTAVSQPPPGAGGTVSPPPDRSRRLLLGVAIAALVVLAVSAAIVVSLLAR